MTSSHQTLSLLEPIKKYDFYIGNIKIQTNKQISTPEDKYELVFGLLNMDSEIKILSIVDTLVIGHRKDDVLNKLKVKLISLQCVASLLDALVETFPEEVLANLQDFCIYELISETKNRIQKREQSLSNSTVKFPEIKLKNEVKIEDDKKPSPLLNCHLNKCHPSNLNDKRKPLKVNPPIFKTNKFI